MNNSYSHIEYVYKHFDHHFNTARQSQLAHKDPTVIPSNSPPHRGADMLSVADLMPRHVTTITGLREAEGGRAHPGLLQRLAELGFLAGETISVLRRGPGGREPIAVQIGDTVFALRRHEASCIQVKVPA